MKAEILIVDDEKDICTQVSGILEDEGYDTRHVMHSDACLKEIRTRRPSLVILDIWLQGSPIDGIDILKIIKKEHPDLPVIMFSGHGNIETAVQTIKAGAYDFIEKPFKSDRLLLVVQHALEAHQLRRENEELRTRAGINHELLGSSSIMKQVRTALDRVAPANSRVLLSGPAGSGKETAARYLHAHSTRVNEPFVVLSCHTLTSQNFESILYGHEEKGSDEVVRKIGLLEQAHKGVLYLDEVADIPIELQSKMARVLQEQCFKRLGGATLIDVDVRVVSATSKDLAGEIEEGRFKEDLFYRLNIVPVHIPYLYAHTEDIPELITRFVSYLRPDMHGIPLQFTEDAMAFLKSYDWPGNVRQLRNVVEWILIMSGESQVIEASMLPPDISPQSSALSELGDHENITSLPLREARSKFEQDYIKLQISKFGGNISRTADFVGMERSALHRKLKALDIRAIKDAKK